MGGFAFIHHPGRAAMQEGGGFAALCERARQACKSRSSASAARRAAQEAAFKAAAAAGAAAAAERHCELEREAEDVLARLCQPQQGGKEIGCVQLCLICPCWHRCMLRPLLRLRTDAKFEMPARNIAPRLHLSEALAVCCLPVAELPGLMLCCRREWVVRIERVQNLVRGRLCRKKHGTAAAGPAAPFTCSAPALFLS